MKILSFILIASALAAQAVAAPGIHSEVGASYFAPRDARLEPVPVPLSVDEPGRVAPFVAVTYGLNDRIGVRLSYHYVNNLRATARFGAPSGLPPPGFPVFVWGHYDDDVHLLSAAPELSWELAPRLTLAIAPQLNWVASRGLVRYSTDYPLILLVAPQRRNDEGFTWGGGARMIWSLDGRSSLSLGYQYVDLEPSFHREAHIISGGLSWKF